MGDASLVHAAGADALGLIIAPSRRRVDVSVARDIADWARGQIRSVIVVRDLDEMAILDAVDAVSPDAVQLHDPTSWLLLDELRRRGQFIIRALSVDDDEIMTFDDAVVDAVLIDGPTPGSGTTHDWGAVRRRSWTRPIIAAGGLTSSNVSTVIGNQWVWGVDVASGVEVSPGHKSDDAVRSFVANARRAFSERS